MKKKKQKEKWYQQRTLIIDMNPFDTQLVVFIDPTEKYIKENLKEVMGKRYTEFDETEIGDWDNSKTHKGRMIKILAGFGILIKVDKNQFRDFVGVLTHEIVHVVQHCLRDRRIGLSEETEEIHAYFTEFLLTTTLKNIY